MPLALRRDARRRAGVLLLASLLGGCAAFLPQSEALRQEPPADLPQSVDLAQVPFFPQKDYQCGPAALATVLVHHGVKTHPDELVQQVYLPARRGSLQVEMLAAPRRHGMVSYQLAPRLEHVLRELAGGIPVLVLQNLAPWPFDVWHYAVVVGYDQERRELLLRSGEQRLQTMPYRVFEYTWKRGHHWAMVAVPPERIPATAEEPRYLGSVSAMERSGHARAGASAYETALRRWPGSLVAAIGLANARHKLGDLKGAETALRDAERRHPDSAVVLNNLAQTLSDDGRNDEALKIIDRAAGLGGAFAPAVRETREGILRRLGRAQ